METVSDFIWGALKSLQMEIAAMKLQKTLTPWKKSYDKPRQHIKKQPTKLHLVKAMVSPVVMYGYESWTIKKAER